MGKRVLDLKQLAQQESFDVTMPNGEVLNLKKPNEQLLIEFMAFQDKVRELENLDVEEKAKAIFRLQRDIVIQILSCNQNDKKIDEAYMEKNGLDFYLQQALIKAYSEYIEEITSDPN